jgi:cytochrome P450
MVDFEQLVTLPYDIRTKELFGYFAESRITAPVRASYQDNVWEVFGYDQAMQVLRDFENFSSDKTSMIPGQFAELAQAARGNFIGLDPPAHTSLRSLVNTAFTPRVINAMEPNIAFLARDILDRALAAGRSVDLVQDYASQLSSAVIAELFGIPRTDHSMFWAWSDGLLGARAHGSLGGADAQAMSRLGALVAEAGAYLLGHIAAKRDAPGSDLTSDLTQVEVDGRRLEDQEIFGIIGMFLIAGHLSSSLLVGNCVLCLDEHPEMRQQAKVHFDPFLEEVLRWRPALIRDQRVTRKAVELSGVSIPAGANVCVWLASANRDEHYFTAGEEFRPGRSDAAHRTFGHGIHYCLGAPLARLEARIAMSVLFERVEEISVLRERVRYHPSIGMLGPVELPVEWR